MVFTPLRISTLALLTCLILAVTSGCDSHSSAKPAVQPWDFASKKAPYSVRVPGQWHKTSGAKLGNPAADLAVTLSGQFYLIVIPQKMPTYEGVASPDALDLQRASLAELKKRVNKFKVQRHGPIKLDGHSALSVFAEGVSQSTPIQYVCTYATRDHWGYQIIAWGPRKEQDGLITATDALLKGWTFAHDAAAKDDATPAAATPPQHAADAGSGADR